MGPSSGATVTQPIRQPVIAQFFEKELTKMIRSAGSITSMKDGARPRGLPEAGSG